MSKLTILPLLLLLACGSRNDAPDLFFPKEVALFAKTTFEANKTEEPLKNLDLENDHVIYDYKHKIFIILDLKKGSIHQVHQKLKSEIEALEKIKKATESTNNENETPKKELYSLSSDSLGQPPLLFDGIHCVTSTDKEALFLLRCTNEPIYQYAIKYTFDKENLISRKVYQMSLTDLQLWGSLSNWPTTWTKPKPIR